MFFGDSSLFSPARFSLASLSRILVMQEPPVENDFTVSEELGGFTEAVRIIIQKIVCFLDLSEKIYNITL
ncbi:hypothetical protein ACFLWU_02775 [Chloroflexota bacterium]